MAGANYDDGNAMSPMGIINISNDNARGGELVGLIAQHGNGTADIIVRLTMGFVKCLGTKGMNRGLRGSELFDDPLG
jgi:hypothetical protein